MREAMIANLIQLKFRYHLVCQQLTFVAIPQFS